MTTLSKSSAILQTSWTSKLWTISCKSPKTFYKDSAKIKKVSPQLIILSRTTRDNPLSRASWWKATVQESRVKTSTAISMICSIGVRITWTGLGITQVEGAKTPLKYWKHHIMKNTWARSIRWNNKINIIKKRYKNYKLIKRLPSKRTCFYSTRFKNWIKESIWWNLIIKRSKHRTPRNIVF